MKRSGKLLIVGGSGFVGSAVARAWRLRPSITTYCNRPLAGAERFDIARERLADRFLQPGHGFSHAILAHGATTLERCALMPEARAINVRGTLQAIDDLVEAGVHPVFLSSDGVFDGTRGRRTEQDAPNPILAYGRQKLAVEAHLQAMTTPWTILRLTRVISGADHPRNLLSQWVGMIEKGTLIRCARDQILAPVDLAYVLQAVAFVVGEGVTGLVHLSGPELVTRA
ncbi:MAG TPA: sugar nucleotide-binding protein, partial [Acidiferrobacterales bacterium]